MQGGITVLIYEWIIALCTSIVLYQDYVLRIQVEMPFKRIYFNLVIIV